MSRKASAEMQGSFFVCGKMKMEASFLCIFCSWIADRTENSQIVIILPVPSIIRWFNMLFAKKFDLRGYKTIFGFFKCVKHTS